MLDSLLETYAHGVDYEKLTTDKYCLVEFTAGYIKVQLTVPHTADEAALRAKIKNAVLTLHDKQKQALNAKVSTKET